MPSLLVLASSLFLGERSVTEDVRKGEISHRIVLRYTEGITTTMRIKFGTRIFKSLLRLLMDTSEMMNCFCFAKKEMFLRQGWFKWLRFAARILNIKGLQELQSQFDRIGKMPKKYLTKAARAGIADSLRKTPKLLFPKGIQKSSEGPLKRKWKHQINAIKACIELPAINCLKYTPNFLKPSSGAWGRPPNAYYPHSVEYGFKKKGRRKSTRTI